MVRYLKIHWTFVLVDELFVVIVWLVLDLLDVMDYYVAFDDMVFGLLILYHYY